MSTLPEVTWQTQSVKDTIRRIAAEDMVALVKMQAKSVSWTYGPHYFTLTLSVSPAHKDYVQGGYGQFRVKLTHWVGDEKKTAYDAMYVNMRHALTEAFRDAFEASKTVPPHIQPKLLLFSEDEKMKGY